MHISLCPLLAAAIVVSTGRSQHLLHDDFSSPSIDPAHWSVTTPLGSSAVFVQNGECVLQDRGYLETVAQFDPVAMGGLEVRGKFRFGGTYDYISILTRCDGIPTAPFGNAQNGIALDISWETAPHFVLSSRSPQILAGPSQWMGGGFQPVPGTSYTFELVDDGQDVRARVEGPNGQWVQLQLPILADTTTAKHVVFHNREPVLFSHQCYLDDVSIGSPNQRWRLANSQLAPPSPRGGAMAFDRHRRANGVVRRLPGRIPVSRDQRRERRDVGMGWRCLAPCGDRECTVSAVLPLDGLRCLAQAHRPVRRARRQRCQPR
jgi:hypothetical protein